jgi:hypothetical protein
VGAGSPAASGHGARVCAGAAAAAPGLVGARTGIRPGLAGRPRVCTRWCCRRAARPTSWPTWTARCSSTCGTIWCFRGRSGQGGLRSSMRPAGWRRRCGVRTRDVGRHAGPDGLPARGDQAVLQPAREQGILLAGGAALLAQHLTTRPTEDLDFFTAPERGHVPAARDAGSRGTEAGLGHRAHPRQRHILPARHPERHS